MARTANKIRQRLIYKVYFSAEGQSGTSDGHAFVINGDSRATSAIGDRGGNLGFFGFDTGGGIKKSYASTFRMWHQGGASSEIGCAASNTTRDPRNYKN